MDQLAEDYRTEQKELLENNDSKNIEYVDGVAYNITLVNSKVARRLAKNIKRYAKEFGFDERS